MGTRLVAPIAAVTQSSPVFVCGVTGLLLLFYQNAVFADAVICDIVQRIAGLLEKRHSGLRRRI